MVNHPNRGSGNRKLAEEHGYFVHEGTRISGTKNIAGRWYVGREGEPLDYWGLGYPSAAQAWAAAAGAVRAAAEAAKLESPGQPKPSERSAE